MITSILIALIWALAVSYAIFTFVLKWFWDQIPAPEPSSATPAEMLSVVIPARNEEKNIGALLADLATQTLPYTQFEVLVMDDSSTDSTAEVVNAFAASTECNIRLVCLPEVPTNSPKKRAIETAISQASGSIIVTTDGDCRVKPGWLEAIAQTFATTNAQLVSAPVTFLDEKSFTDHLQTVEFSSLIGSGASAIAVGRPSLCNGANLSYRKSAFLEVGGFEGVKHIASGDDEFLMHKIAYAFPGSIGFLKSPEAVVLTTPHQKWSDFFRQRKRWASKWKHYQTKTPLVLAIYVFASNLALITGEVLWLSGQFTTAHFALFAAVKCIPEWFFLGSILHFLGKKKSILFIPVTQIFYPYYVCFFGLAAQRPSYYWKGRKLV